MISDDIQCFFFALLAIFLLKKLFTWKIDDMTVSTPMPPRPDHTKMNNIFGGTSGPQNPYGAPINIPPPQRTAP